MAMEYIGVSCLCNALLSVPLDTKWDDITNNAKGAKHVLHKAIKWLHMQRQAFKALGLQPPQEVLLHSLPGCAKTKLVRAAANAAGVAFLLLGPTDMFATF